MFALEGITVLDFGQFLAGPFATMIMADLGADVIKVEPTRGDSMRMGKPFIGCQRGKRCIAIDLKTDEGRQLVYRLVEKADVVHHNMTKGTAAKLGIDYESLRQHKPDLIYCNTFAYGAEGPMSQFGGLDPLFQAAAGLEYEAGAVSEGNPPLWLRFGMSDTANALASVQAVLLALYHRALTGRGQDVTTSLLSASTLYSSEFFLVDGQPGPRRPGLDKALTGTGPGYRLYRTQDAWIQVAAVRPEHWATLCRVVGRPELAAADPADRSIEGDLEDAFMTRTSRAWWLALDEANVPAEVPVETNDGEAVLFDADNERLGLVAEYEHPLLGRLRQFGTLIGFSDTPGEIQGPPPLLGEHTRQIMSDAGYDAAAISDLMARGIVGEPGDDYRWSV